MTKNLELAKKLAVLGWIHRNGFISDDEYARARSRIMGEYKICSFMAVQIDSYIRSDNEPSDSNHGITLKEAKSNFSKFGACEKEMLCYVRPPRDDEKEILQRQLPVCRTNETQKTI